MSWHPAGPACHNEKVIDVTFYCKHAASFKLSLVKALQASLNEGSRFLWQVWMLDSSLPFFFFLVVLWVLLTHLEAFLSKGFLVEEHAAKCVISDTSPVPSRTGLNLCSLSYIRLCEDMKKWMLSFSFMWQHVSSNCPSFSLHEHAS